MSFFNFLDMIDWAYVPVLIVFYLIYKNDKARQTVENMGKKVLRMIEKGEI